MLCELCQQEKHDGKSEYGVFICSDCIADDPERASGIFYFHQQNPAEPQDEVHEDYWREMELQAEKEAMLQETIAYWEQYEEK
jgi:hypothetical protein